MITPCCSRPRGFTLIELLTVIAIIGILAAILIPILGKVREVAATTKCVANLRSWGNATMLFVNDNKGKLPPTAYAAGSTVNGIYYPALAQDGYTFLNRYVLPPGSPSVTWGYNHVELASYTCTNRNDAGNNLTWGAYGFNHYPSAMTFNNISAPGRLVWATEAAGGGGGQRWITPGMLNANQINFLGAIRPHGTRNNLLYLDGHVATRAINEVTRADFTRDSTAYNTSHETQFLVN